MKRWRLTIGLLLVCAALILVHQHRLSDLPRSRVEVLTDNEGIVKQVCDDAHLMLPVREGDRWVLESPDLFTAQQVETALVKAGEEAVVLDYSWAEDVLRQSGQLWIAVSTMALLWLLIQVGRTQILLETWRLRQSQQYPLAYLYDSGTRLLLKLIVGILGVIGAVLLVRHLLEAPVYLPGTLLPQGSLFQKEHYHQWAATTFPPAEVSQYGRQLCIALKSSYILVAMETLLIALLSWATHRAMGRKE